MTQREYSPEGFFEVAANPLSRAGVFPYTARSIGYPGWENDPGKIIMVYRPEEELGDPETVASARLQPWVNDHTLLGNPDINPALTPAEKKGVHGTIGEQVFYDASDRTLYANLKLWSPSLDDAIAAGKKELSMGFRCVYDFTPGDFEGQAYQAIQRGIRFNHLATVGKGRMGPGVAVLDHASFTFDENDLREIQPMKKTRRSILAAKLGVAPAALAAAIGMDAADVETLKKWNVAMDAEEDAPAEGEGGGGEPTISEAAETIKDIAGPLGELQSALAELAGAPADPAADPGIDEDMEPVLDAAGQPVTDPATGKPKMQKKAAPAADATAPAMAACDSAIRALSATSKAAHAKLGGKSAPAELVAFDAALADASASLRAVRERRAQAGGLGAIRHALDSLEKTVTAAVSAKPTTVGDVMKQIASRDALYKRVSPFIGAFDHAEMDETQVAKYACDKLELGAPAGSELAYLQGFLKNRPVETPRAASAFAVDSAVKSSSRAADFIAGKPVAA